MVKMKLLGQLMCFTFFTRCALSQEIRDMNAQQLLKLAEDITAVRPKPVHPSDVSFHLFSRNISGKILDPESDEDLDPSKISKFLIHGWLENHLQSWYQNLTEELLINDDHNVIQVDWAPAARSNYISSAKLTRLVGDTVGLFILNQNLTDVHLIGHSLGAHVAGFASKRIKKEGGNPVGRITGLDPAGPYFRQPNVNTNDRLSSNDAGIVDVIHTDGGFYGYERPIGTLDLYFNGGIRPQPGCVQNLRIVPLGELIQNMYCSHTKSYHYFIQAINKKKYSCVKCPSWERFLEGQCRGNSHYVYGAEEITEDMTGICFVNTRNIRRSLFGEGFNGLLRI